MRRLTYPCFDGRKLPNLFYLDISGLDLSDKFMKTLHHLPQAPYFNPHRNKYLFVLSHRMNPFKHCF